MMQKRSLKQPLTHGFNTLVRTACATAAALLLLVFASCERRPLELYYNGSVEVHFVYDWQSYYEPYYRDYPDGMTVILARDGDSVVHTEPFHSVNEITMRLQPGTYRMITMNMTYGEFAGNMYFINEKSHDRLYAKSYTWRQNAANVWDAERTYLEEPYAIGVAVDTFTVPRMVDDIVFYDYRTRYRGDTLLLERRQTVKPMTTKLYVRLKVKGIKYMSDVEGFVTGLSDGFLMSHTWRHTNTGAVKLTGFSARAVDGEPDTAWLTFVVNTFGLPHGREQLSSRQDNSNLLQLCFTLVDEKRHYLNYNVGKLIHYKKKDEETFTRDDVTTPLEIVIDPIELPYAQPVGTGSFDAEVTPWEDTENVEVAI